MKCADRYEELKDEDFDTIILRIKMNQIKCGRYSHLVKVDKNKVYDDKKKEFFKEES